MLQFPGRAVKLSTCSSMFCLYHILWLLICSLLLMADSLSAVPHQMHNPVLSTTIDFQVSFACSSDFILHRTHCYRYFGAESRRAFYHAEKQCAHYHSTLVSLLSHDEEEFVVQLAANNTAFWIGLNDDDGPGSTHREGVFKWTSGEEHSSDGNNNYYENWKSGEPNNRRHLDCVKADAYGWAMAAGGCAAAKLPFVCKKKACPKGLDWDGASCNLIVAEDNARDDSDAFHWSIMRRWQTLIFMLLASFVVMVASLLALRARSANKSRTFGLNLNLRDKRRFVNSRTFRTPLVNRVEDLVPKPLL